MCCVQDLKARFPYLQKKACGENACRLQSRRILARQGVRSMPTDGKAITNSLKSVALNPFHYRLTRPWPLLTNSRKLYIK